MAHPISDVSRHRPGPSTAPLVILGAGVLAWRMLLQLGQRTSWHYFAEAASGLVHGPGLDLYRVHPEFQFGPIAVLVALAFQALPPWMVRPGVEIVGFGLG